MIRRSYAARHTPTRLVLINGAPGSGKSTLAAALAAQTPMMLALDIDSIKHSLGRWDADLAAAGLHARRLAIALVREQLTAGFDVVIGQYLARTEFIETLERTAEESGARFTEVMLDLDLGTLTARLAYRRSSPNRPEHSVNNRLVGPEDAPRLAESIELIRKLRPGAHSIDARRSLADTLAALADLLGRPEFDHWG